MWISGCTIDWHKFLCGDDMNEPIVPPNRQGKKVDLQERIELPTEAEAQYKFLEAKRRLLNPSIWKKLCDGFSADFALMDDKGRSKTPPAKKGDYVRIDLPAPGNKTGDGYDWVIIDELVAVSDASKDSETMAITLRPASNPTEKEAATAHFFKEAATSTITIRRTGTEVEAAYNGRKEVPNNETGKMLDNIRNSLVAVAALAGVSEGQWGKLIKSILEGDVDD